MTSQTLPATAPVTTAEYMAWRRDPPATHRARREPPVGPDGSADAIMAIQDQQSVEHYASTLLRRDDVAERLFGTRGRVRFLKYYLVPSRWVVRADAVFLPRDGSAASILRVRAAEPEHDSNGAFAPATADLFELAYERFTMRQAGTPVDRCLMLLLNPKHRSDLDALDLEEMFECHDVTRFIDRAPSRTAATIAAAVAEEAVLAADYLQRDAIAGVELEIRDGFPEAVHEVLTPASRADVGRILGRATHADGADDVG